MKLISFDILVVAVVVICDAGTYLMCIGFSVDKSERRRRAHTDNTQQRRPPQTMRIDDDDRLTECFQKSWVTMRKLLFEECFQCNLMRRGNFFKHENRQRPPDARTLTTRDTEDWRLMTTGARDDDDNAQPATIADGCPHKQSRCSSMFQSINFRCGRWWMHMTRFEDEDFDSYMIPEDEFW